MSEDLEKSRREFVANMPKYVAALGFGAGAAETNKRLTTDFYEVPLDEGLTIEENGNKWSFNILENPPEGVEAPNDNLYPDYTLSATLNGRNLGEYHFEMKDYGFPDSEIIDYNGDILAKVYLEETDDKDVMRLGFKKGV